MQVDQKNQTPRQRNRLFLSLGFAVLFLFSLFLLWKVLQFHNQMESFQEKQHALTVKADSLLKALRETPELKPSPTFLTSYDIRRLKERGLSHPIQDLQADLAGSPDLIPQEGVLGGTMHFYPDQIYVLTDRWVLAYFDDGHIAGYAWLRYTVQQGGEITWKVLNSYLM